MEDPSGDPRGWLQACPELERFSTEPSIAAAISRGDGFALMSALRERRAARRGPGEERALDAILARRRLFTAPVGSAPALFTFNGIGSRIYGRSDPAPDGSYVGTLFFTLLYLPIWPIAQYLVASEGSRYLFLGKVPLSATLKVWRVAVLALTVALVGAAGYGSWSGGRTARVHLLNGLDVPVVVEAPGVRVELPPTEGHRAVVLPTGRGHLRSRTTDGRLLEELDVEIPARTPLVAYSVLGTAPLVIEGIFYGPAAAARTTRTRVDVYAGRSFTAERSVSWVFEAAPQKLQVREQGEIRTRAWAPQGGWRAAIGMLEHERRDKDAARLARAVLEATPRAEGVLDRALAAAHRAGGSAEALAVAERAVSLAPDDVDAHRARQEYLRALGRAEDARRIYRALEAHDPGSPLAVYLRARIEDGAQNERLFAAALRRFPDDPNILRAVAWGHHVAGRPREAIRVWDRLEKVQPAAADPLHGQRAVDLVAAGRGAEAARFLAARLDAKGSDLPGALLYARVARLAAKPPRPPRYYLDALTSPLDPGTAAYVRTLVASTLGDAPPSAKELSAIEDEDARAAALLIHDAVEVPGAAVKSLARASRRVADQVDPTLRLLLGAEAARTDPGLVAPIVADVGFRPALADLVARFVRGEEPFELSNLEPDQRAALLLGRARALEAAGRDARAVYAEVRRREVVPGPVSVALARWPRPGAAGHP
jgi:tetratricopeptide (TPR) repeat protein